MRLFLDFETRSDLDVRKVGAFRYAEDPSTAILCCAWAVDSDPVEVLTYEDLCVDEPVPQYEALKDLMRRAFANQMVFVAHNIDFERNILKQKVGEVPALDCWEDTAAWSACSGLPRKLEDLAKFLWPDDPKSQKDMAGNRIMLQLSRPRTPTAKNPAKWITPAMAPEKFAKLYAYCAKDVEVMRAAHARLRPPSEQERRIWALTDRMNWAGVKIDTASLAPAQAYLARQLAPVEAEFKTHCPYLPKSYALVAKHFGMPDVKKVSVRHKLREPGLDKGVARALALFRTLAVSSPAKLSAMQDRVSLDGRLRGALVYGGAERTLRWSSWGVQLQNLVRGLGELTDEAFEALLADTLDLIYVGIERQAPAPPNDEISLIAEMLRGFLLGPFLAGDFSQIEARTLLWFAGQEDLLEMFRQKKDLYCAMATSIYGRPITKKDKAERFMGKQVVLGCGYRMGHVRFKNMLDDIYDVAIDEAFAKKVVATYRASVPHVVKLWDVLIKGFIFVTRQKAKRVKVGPVYMGSTEFGGVFYVWIELPSGRRLWYADAHIKGREVRYYGRNIYKGGAWEHVPTHGGKIAENITQAMSRDIMADAMLRLDAAGFRLNFTVHDEIVADDDVERDRIEEFTNLLTEVPAYAAGLPLDVEAFRCSRYRK